MIYSYGYSYPKAKILGVVTYDTDAEVYFTAASITNTTEKNAANQFFLDIKGLGVTTNDSNIYSKFVALYLISPTSLAAAAVNAVNPSTYDLTFINSPTFATTGVTLNGTTQYIKTSIIPSTDLTINSLSLGLYSRTELIGSSFMGCLQTSTQRLWFSGRDSVDRAISNIYSSAASLNPTNTVSKAFNTYSRRASNDQEIYKNGVSLGSNALSGGTQPTIEIYLGARNNSGTADSMVNEEFAGSYVSSGLTDNEMTDLFDAMNKYQTNVIAGGRNV